MAVTLLHMSGWGKGCGPPLCINRYAEGEGAQRGQHAGCFALHVTMYVCPEKRCDVMLRRVTPTLFTRWA